MNGTSGNVGGADNQRSTIMENLLAAERRVAVLEAQLVAERADRRDALAELEVERRNSSSLQQALDSLQTQCRRLRTGTDEMARPQNAQPLQRQLDRNAELRQQLEDLMRPQLVESAENEELKNQLQSTNDLLSTRLSAATDLEDELKRAKEESEQHKAEAEDLRRRLRELQGSHDHRRDNAEPDPAVAIVAEMPLGPAVAAVQQQQQNEGQLANPITITRIIPLFHSFLKGKHLNDEAAVRSEVDAFMREFEVPGDLVEQLRRDLLNTGQIVRSFRRRRQGQ